MEDVKKEVDAGGSAGIDNISSEYYSNVDSPPWGYCDVDLCPPAAPTPDPDALAPTPAPGGHPASTICKPGQFERIDSVSLTKSLGCLNCTVGLYAPHAIAVPDLVEGRTGPNYREGCIECPGGYYTTPSKHKCTKQCRDATNLEVKELFASDALMTAMRQGFYYNFGKDLLSCKQLADKVEDFYGQRYSLCDGTGGFTEIATSLCPVSCKACPCSGKFPSNCPNCETGKFQSTPTFKSKTASCAYCAQVRCRNEPHR
jgi:hypothetical protein